MMTIRQEKTQKNKANQIRKVLGLPAKTVNPADCMSPQNGSSTPIAVTKAGLDEERFRKLKYVLTVEIPTDSEISLLINQNMSSNEDGT